MTDILKKYARSAQSSGVADISDEITPHRLRHSKAMHLLQAGVNLVYIRNLLGHADISTTEIYARADERMKRKALMEAYHNNLLAITHSAFLRSYGYDLCHLFSSVTLFSF